MIAFALMMTESTFLGEEVKRGLSCFFGGTIVYLIYKYLHDIYLPKLLGTALELLAIMSVFWAIQVNFAYRDTIAIFLFFGFILTFSFESGFLSSFLKKALFQTLGKLSYSIYLTHSVIIFGLNSVAIGMQKMTGIIFAPMIGGVRFVTFGNVTINNMTVLVTLLMIILTSRITYQYIERKGGQVIAIKLKKMMAVL
jgi:peptidoglycan/LPS O-acetylase OafA/YrhL